MSLIGGACGGDASEAGAPAENTLSGLSMPISAEAREFVLTDTEGRPFDFAARSRGRVTVLFFGFTHCPDICPVHMANIAAALGDIGWEARDQVQVVFVSTDPGRDTPERIREWLDKFDPDFIGLRGPLDEVNRVQRGLGLPEAIIEDTEGDDYQVGHAGQVMVFAADDESRFVYPFGTRQSDWAHDLPLLVAGTWADEQPGFEHQTPVTPPRVIEAPDEGLGQVTVSDVYIGVPVTGDLASLYFTIQNHGASVDSLLGVTTPVATRTELHRTARSDGRVVMQQVAVVPVPSGREVRFTPGERHVMLIDLKRSLEAGDRVDVSLRFSRAGVLPATAEVLVYTELEREESR